MRSLFAGALALAVLALASPSHAQQQGANPLPPGEGRDIVAAACVQCHGPNVFVQLRQGPEAWRFLVYDMVLRGAQVQPSEIQPVVNYLVTNFGPGNNVPPAMVQVSLPDGGGKSLVEQRCALCHGLDRAAGTRRGRAEWDRIMSRMIFLGAPVSSDEAKTITSYLHDKLGTK
jgi:mono/diheme cytochrome c family protein